MSPHQAFNAAYENIIMVKSPSEATVNYVASVPMAMWKYKKSLMRDKGFKQDYAIEKAIDYGEKMLEAGFSKIVTPQLAIALYREFAEINTSLADRLEREAEERS